ncbi:uncharacterized protein METZ01_LOCUS191356 [marine metagenome]|jgi:hypothetical protein|uniref:Uncharacterized protein n=1 Tax=marine metagenome TaxID=408172 RepID=A0A382DKE2_9ZZZZ|tara:strand:- start:4487 stop:4675 length:189 start_codon:yes stop_codon:yes gene_type:complete
MPKKKKRKKKQQEPFVDMIWMHHDLWNNSGRTREDIEEEVYGVTNTAGYKSINYPKGHPKNP